MDAAEFHPELSEEQRMLLGTVAELAAAAVVPAAEGIDAEAAIPAELAAHLAELGMLAVPIPEDAGGAGFDRVGYALTLVELAAASPSVALHVAAQTTGFLEPLARFGEGDATEAAFGEVATGGALGCFGGSDVADGELGSIACTIADSGEGVTVTGSKRWVPAAPGARWCLVLGREGDEVSAALVDLDGAGVTRGARLDRMGMNGVAFGDVDLEGAPGARVGPAGRGAELHDFVRDRALVALAAIGCGAMRGVRDFAARYAGERQQFGRRIGDFEAIEGRLAAIESDRVTALNLVVSAARLLDAARPATHLAEIAKLAAGRGAMAASDHALQIYGGYGYSREYPVERFYRDARWVAIAWGGNDALVRALGARVQPAAS